MKDDALFINIDDKDKLQCSDRKDVTIPFVESAVFGGVLLSNNRLDFVLVIHSDNALDS